MRRNIHPIWNYHSQVFVIEHNQISFIVFRHQNQINIMFGRHAMPNLYFITIICTKRCFRVFASDIHYCILAFAWLLQNPLVALTLLATKLFISFRRKVLFNSKNGKYVGEMHIWSTMHTKMILYYTVLKV